MLEQPLKLGLNSSDTFFFTLDIYGEHGCFCLTKHVSGDKIETGEKRFSLVN
jgi:hypothetical protein